MSSSVFVREDGQKIAIDDRLFDILLEVGKAVNAADVKHGANSITQIPAESHKWLPILVEEVGEIANSLTYDSLNLPEETRSELIDVITVCIAWVSAIDALRNTGVSE